MPDSPKQVVSPNEAMPPNTSVLAGAVEQAVRQADAKPAPPKQTGTSYVRNILPNATVTLKDGTTVTFTRYLFTTSDKALIQKLDEEGPGQHIYRREPKEQV